jgi:hypothetical protein
MMAIAPTAVPTDIPTIAPVERPVFVACAEIAMLEGEDEADDVGLIALAAGGARLVSSVDWVGRLSIDAGSVVGLLAGADNIEVIENGWKGIETDKLALEGDGSHMDDATLGRPPVGRLPVGRLPVDNIGGKSLSPNLIPFPSSTFPSPSFSLCFRGPTTSKLIVATFCMIGNLKL